MNYQYPTRAAALNALTRNGFYINNKGEIVPVTSKTLENIGLKGRVGYLDSDAFRIQKILRDERICLAPVGKLEKRVVELFERNLPWDTLKARNYLARGLEHSEGLIHNSSDLLKEGQIAAC